MFFELVRSSGDLQSLAVTAAAIITAFVVGIGFHEFWNFFLANVIVYTVYINVLLGVFNLLPIPPLDGYRVALRILPTEIAAAYQRVEQYGPFILMALFAIPFFTGSRINPINDVIGPVRESVTRYLLGG